MRSRCSRELLFVCVACTVLLCHCGGTTVGPANLSDGNIMHEFGYVKEGEPVFHTFKLRNDVRAAVSVDEVNVTCQCTQLNSNIVGTHLSPGDWLSVPLSVDTKGLSGHVTQVALLTLSSGQIVKLTMKGIVEAMSGGQHPDIGPILAGKTYELPLPQLLHGTDVSQIKLIHSDEIRCDLQKQ